MSELPIRLHPPKISGSDWNNLVTYGLILTGDSWPVDYTSGQIFYRTDLNNFYYYNGALWKEIGFVTGSTTNWDNIVANTVEVLDLLTVDKEQVFKDTGNIIVITGSNHWVVPKPGYTPTNNYLYLYATMISPADRTTVITDPVLCTNQAFFVEKDTYTHGFLGTASDPEKAMGGGALLMGQGFTGRYCPPLFDLTGTIVDMDDPLGGYASGSSFPAAENYAWFYRTDEETLYQYTNSTWNSMFTNVKSSEYDTLFLIRSDTSGPANLYLNNLNVNTIYPQANSWVTIDEKLLLNGNFQIANGWVVSSLNPSGSGLGIGSPTEQWSGSCVQVMFTDDITALNNAWVDINNKLVVHGNFQITDGWVVSSLNPSGSNLALGSATEQWSGSCVQGMYTDDIHALNNAWVDINDKLVVHGDFQISDGWVVSSLNPSGSNLALGSPSEQWSGSCVQGMYVDDIEALNNAWVDINDKLVVHGDFQITDGWVVSSLNPSGSGLGIGSPTEQWSGSCIQGIYTDDISALNNSWVDINDKLVVHGDFQISDGWVVSSLNPSGSVGLGSATEKWTGIVATTGYFDAIEMSGSNMTIKYTGSYIGFRNGETRLYSSSNSVLSIQDVSGNLGTLNVSNIFVDHINSASADGIYILDNIRILSTGSWIGFRDNKTRLYSNADGVLSIHDDLGSLSTLNASNVFVDHINSATGNGIYLLDNIRFYDGDSGVKLFDGVNSTGSAGQVLVVNSSGYPVWSGSGGGQWTAGTVSSVTTPLYINSNSLKIYTASTSTSGSLTATDWNTFNNKYGSGSTAILSGITLRNGAYSAGISVNASHVIEIGDLPVQINKATTVGDGTNGLSVSGNTGITGVLNVDKLTLSGSYGNAGQYLTSSGSGNRPYWSSTTSWNGGVVTNDIIISKNDPALRLSESTTTNMVMIAEDGISYIESGLTSGLDSKAPIRFTSMLAGTTWMTIETDGQVTIPTTGADAGVLIGGDTQIYRSTNNVLFTPDTWNIVGHCIITGSASYFALRNGATRMYSDADGVLKVHTGAGALGTLTVSNVFTDHINSASAGGVYMYDSLRLYDGAAGEKLYDATNDSGASGEILTVNASGLPIWATGSGWNGGTVTNDILISKTDAALRLQDGSDGLFVMISADGTNYIESGVTAVSDSKAPIHFTSMYIGSTWMVINTDGQVQIPTQSASAGLLIGQDVQLFRSGSNTLCIPDFVNIDPPSGNGKLDIRTKSDDAILNLVSGGNLKATFAYDTSSGSTWLSAFSNSTTYSELHLVGSSIQLENDVKAKGNIAINKTNPALAFQVSGSTKLAMGYDGSNTYMTVSSASGNNNFNFVNNSGSINFTSSSGKIYTVSGLQICPNTGGTGQIGNSTEYYYASYVDYVYGKHNGLFGCERSKSGQEWSHEYTTEFDALEYLTHELTKTKFHITYDQKDDKKIICTCGKSVENPCPEHIDEWNDKYTVNTGKITQATGLVVLEQSAKIAKLEMEIVSLKEQIKNTRG